MRIPNDKLEKFRLRYTNCDIHVAPLIKHAVSEVSNLLRIKTTERVTRKVSLTLICSKASSSTSGQCFKGKLNKDFTVS